MRGSSGDVIRTSNHLEWVLLSVREKQRWVVLGLIPYCGWRYGKAIHKVKCGKVDYLLSGICYGPDKTSSVDCLNEALEFFRTIQFPYLNECVECWANDGGILFIHPLFPSGTLRDYLHKSHWKDEFLKKYCIDHQLTSLELIDVRLICRQVLEALSFLNALSIPYR
ncbi:unnamed protein product [Dracunculus medinensis]|uniref:Protein kinase domain-containing protein n=1 Tax=Dracunculus medinensis TaxID=318479 RepID=A0A0N4UPA5_DRAME|nr:unnamed protein product [Dracunculus medinensis]